MRSKKLVVWCYGESGKFCGLEKQYDYEGDVEMQVDAEYPCALEYNFLEITGSMDGTKTGYR